MKVALFTETYINAVNGVAAHVKTLKYGLEKLGHQVLIVTADKHCKHHYVEDGILHCPSVEIKRFYGFGAAPPYSRKRLKFIANFDPDIIHIHHEFGIGISGILASKMQRRPLVYTLHTMYDQYIYYIAPRFFLRAATKFSHQYERIIAQSAHALTGPSQKCDEYFKRIGVKKELNLIPNSADPDTFDPSKVTEEQREAVRKAHNLSPDQTLVLFVGRLGQEKSVDVLLKYLAQTVTPQDKIRLLVIGEGPEKEALEQLAVDLGISDIVTFVGLVKHGDMPAYYAVGDVYATASLSEMNSISMLEGMASGLPTLQRYDELNADQIKAGVNGSLYQTAEELIAELRNIAAMTTEERAAMKAQVRSSVVDRGSSDIAEYMLSVYEKAIAEQNEALKRQRYVRKS